MPRQTDLFTWAAKDAAKRISGSQRESAANGVTCSLCGHASGVNYYNRSVPRSIVNLCLTCYAEHCDVLQEHRIT